MSLRGVALVARQELRTRLRTGRWKLLLAIWFVVVNGLGVLFGLAIAVGEHDDQTPGVVGVPMFGGVLLGVLALVLLVAPALTAQSINGDRERGTLATLQVTALEPGDIAFGKLLAAWGTGLAVLALTLPVVSWPVLVGDVTVARAAVVLAVTALLIGVVCALSQGWSALVARSITSSLLSYLTVFVLLVGTVVVFFLAIPLTTTNEWYESPYGERVPIRRSHPERVWWLLAPNPFVVLADAAPQLPERRPKSPGEDHEGAQPFDPLGDIGEEVRKTRQPDRPGEYPGYRDAADRAPVWPYGLGFDILLAGGAMWVTIRRLRTPARSLPKGVRLA
jgi:ABC-2 type transport system permease protein